MEHFVNYFYQKLNFTIQNRVIFTVLHLLENKIEPNCDKIGVKMNIILNMLSRKEYLMSYENAMQWLKDLNLNNEPIYDIIYLPIFTNGVIMYGASCSYHSSKVTVNQWLFCCLKRVRFSLIFFKESCYINDYKDHAP